MSSCVVFEYSWLELALIASTAKNRCCPKTAGIASQLTIRWLARRINGELDLKGGYSLETESEYFRQIELHSTEFGVNCQVVKSTFSAFKIYKHYDVIVFDSIGRGFFESISMNIATLHLPTARFVPVREPSDKISEFFFTDTFDGSQKGESLELT